MHEWTIGELARQAGLRPSALRYYEDFGILPLPRRLNGRRRYDADALGRLAVIQVAQQAGFTLAEIRTLIRGFSPRTAPSARWQALARRKLPQIEGLIRRARGMKRMLEAGLRCGCLRLRDCGLVGARVRRMEQAASRRRVRRALHAARGSE